MHLNFFPQATASIHVKEEFGDVNCFFLSVAKIIYKISLLLTRCSRQEGLKLQKKLLPPYLCRDVVPAAAFPLSDVRDISAESGTHSLKSNNMRKASYFPKPNTLLVPGEEEYSGTISQGASKESLCSWRPHEGRGLTAWYRRALVLL